MIYGQPHLCWYTHVCQMCIPQVPRCVPPFHGCQHVSSRRNMFVVYYNKVVPDS